MSFVVREVQREDLSQLVELAKQFSLLNLPADKKVLGEKIERSEQSFAKKLPRNEADYLFVLEDTEEKMIVGSSLIMAKHGTPDEPHSSFKVLERNHVSQDLGIGFIHKVLRFHWDENGPTEIGGLLVDRLYRKRPEKLGKQISLARFLYIAMFRRDFENRVLCELTPPLTEEGRSEFWESLGRRFTGLPYQEADILSQGNKEFIRSLFPEQDIYMCLLDSKARLVCGRVGEETKPAQHLLESIGFKYTEEVDPFDGGPHFGAAMDDVLPIKLSKKMFVDEKAGASYTQQGLVAFNGDQGFRSGLATFAVIGDRICLAPTSKQALGLEKGQEVLMCPFDFSKIGKG